MKKMIAYCGLDCEKCDTYLATINANQVLREKTAKLWSELNHASRIGTAICIFKKLFDEWPKKLEL